MAFENYTLLKVDILEKLSKQVSLQRKIQNAKIFNLLSLS